MKLQINRDYFMSHHKDCNDPITNRTVFHGSSHSVNSKGLILFPNYVHVYLHTIYFIYVYVYM